MNPHQNVVPPYLLLPPNVLVNKINKLYSVTRVIDNIIYVTRWVKVVRAPSTKEMSGTRPVPKKVGSYRARFGLLRVRR